MTTFCQVQKKTKNADLATKVHKDNIPVRPALSMPGSPYYKVAKKTQNGY